MHYSFRSFTARGGTLIVTHDHMTSKLTFRLSDSDSESSPAGPVAVKTPPSTSSSIDLPSHEGTRKKSLPTLSAAPSPHIAKAPVTSHQLVSQFLPEPIADLEDEALVAALETGIKSYQAKRAGDQSSLALAVPISQSSAVVEDGRNNIDSVAPVARAHPDLLADSNSDADPARSRAVLDGSMSTATASEVDASVVEARADPPPLPAPRSVDAGVALPSSTDALPAHAVHHRPSQRSSSQRGYAARHHNATSAATVVPRSAKAQSKPLLAEPEVPPQPVRGEKHHRAQGHSLYGQWCRKVEKHRAKSQEVTAARRAVETAQCTFKPTLTTLGQQAQPRAFDPVAEANLPTVQVAPCPHLCAESLRLVSRLRQSSPFARLDVAERLIVDSKLRNTRQQLSLVLEQFEFIRNQVGGGVVLPHDYTTAVIERLSSASQPIGGTIAEGASSTSLGESPRLDRTAVSDMVHRLSIPKSPVGQSVGLPRPSPAVGVVSRCLAEKARSSRHESMYETLLRLCGASTDSSLDGSTVFLLREDLQRLLSRGGDTDAIAVARLVLSSHQRSHSGTADVPSIISKNAFVAALVDAEANYGPQPWSFRGASPTPPRTGCTFSPLLTDETQRLAAAMNRVSVVRGGECARELFVQRLLAQGELSKKRTEQLRSELTADKTSALRQACTFRPSINVGGYQQAPPRRVHDPASPRAEVADVKENVFSIRRDSSTQWEDQRQTSSQSPEIATADSVDPAAAKSPVRRSHSRPVDDEPQELLIRVAKCHKKHEVAQMRPLTARGIEAREAERRHLAEIGRSLARRQESDISQLARRILQRR